MSSQPPPTLLGIIIDQQPSPLTRSEECKLLLTWILIHNAKPGDVLKWVLSHSPNPLPQATKNSITKLVTSIRVEQSIEYQNPLNRDKPSIDVAVSTYITNIDKIRQLLSEVSREERNMVASELGSQGYGIFGGVISALKDIIHHRAANVPDHEAIRSTIISACCGPDVTFQALSKMLGIYLATETISSWK